jgi:hypothetical protein
VHDSGDIGKAIARMAQEGLVGSVFGSMSNELRYRLTLEGSRPLHLLIQLSIKTKASHDISVSHVNASVSRRSKERMQLEPPPTGGSPCQQVRPADL